MRTLVVLLQDPQQTWQMDTMEDVTPHYVIVNQWNHDLSPWATKGIFKNQDFTGGADQFLEEIEKQISVDGYDAVYIAGYSLAGLFALYACSKSDVFTGCVCASGSLWYPDFLTYLETCQMKEKKIYLSLGDKEKNSKNSVLKTIEDCTKQAYDILKANNTIHYELREGGHFVEEKPHVQRGINKLLTLYNEFQNEI